ncbi:hypothetical protein E4U41_005154 [Claviceps citrina]|nr:hypothetical protein E4U41_005154 [Claviceps citrina]
MAAPAYIISRVADPIFAVLIGVSAAAMRINREETAKGYTAQQTVDNALRYALWHGRVMVMTVGMLTGVLLPN